MNQAASLSNQLAVVTGASRGIGAAIARKLAALGALDKDEGFVKA